MASAAVRLQIELDDTKSCFQFTKTMTKVEKQITIGWTSSQIKT